MAENLAVWVLIGAGLGLAIGILSSQVQKFLLRPFNVSYESIDRWVGAHPWLTAAMGAFGGVIAWLILRVFTQNGSMLQLGAMASSLAAGSYLRARWLSRHKGTPFPKG